MSFTLEKRKGLSAAQFEQSYEDSIEAYVLEHKRLQYAKFALDVAYPDQVQAAKKVLEGVKKDYQWAKESLKAQRDRYMRVKKRQA